MNKNVYQTATVVTGLSMAERALGFLYRIVLSRLIGAEGLGLYQIALSVFSVFVTVGTGGIPVSVSRLVSKSKAENDIRGESGSLSAGVCASLLLTVPVLLLFWFFQDAFSFLFSDLRARELFGILLFGLIFTCLYAVVRGSFWGDKKFLVTSSLEILEEAVMVVVGVVLLQSVATPFDGAKKACVAVVISYFVSFSFSLLCLLFHKKRLSSPKGLLRPLLSSALPITAVRASGSLLSSAVAVILPAMLVRAGKSGAEALEIFGVVSGMVLPVLFVPATLIGSISLVLVPELSEDFYKARTERLQKNVERGVFSSVLVASVLIALFSAIGEDLGLLLYSNPLAGEMIKTCAFILLPMSLTMITTGILNSMNYERQTLVYYFIGAGAMIACVFILPPVLGAYSYPAGLALSYLLTSILNLSYLHKKIPFSLSLFKRTLKAVLCCVPAALFGRFLLPIFNGVFIAPVSLAFCAVLTLVFIFLSYLVAGVLDFQKNKRIFAKKSTQPHRIFLT